MLVIVVHGTERARLLAPMRVHHTLASGCRVCEHFKTQCVGSSCLKFPRNVEELFHYQAWFCQRMDNLLGGAYVVRGMIE